MVDVYTSLKNPTLALLSSLTLIARFNGLNTIIHIR